MDGSQPILTLGVANDGIDRTLDLVEGPLGSAALIRRYTHGQSVDEPLQMEVFDDDGQGGISRAEIYSYHADHLGSIRALTNSAGNVSHAYDYDSYGRLVAEVEPTQTAAKSPFRFTGREWDTSAELYYYRARGYDAEIGRFLQEDPLDFAAGDPNVYRYAISNPLSYRDPSGKLVEAGLAGANHVATIGQPIKAVGDGLNCLFGSIASVLGAFNEATQRGERVVDASVDIGGCAAAVITATRPEFQGDVDKTVKQQAKGIVRQAIYNVLVKRFVPGFPRLATTVSPTATPAYPSTWRGR